MPTTISHTRKVNLVHQDTAPRHLSLLDKLLMLFAPKKRAESIQKGLKQANQIHKGKIQAKSFEEAIDEL